MLNPVMPQNLKDLEQELRRKIIDENHVPPKAKELRQMFLLSFVSAPFLAMTFMFVPVLGQLLTTLGLITTAFYLKLRRSAKLLLCWILGNVMFFSLLSILMPLIRKRLDVPLFTVLVLGIPYCALYLLIIAYQTWKVANPVEKDSQL